jgi:hypothetical protein
VSDEHLGDVEQAATPVVDGGEAALTALDVVVLARVDGQELEMQRYTIRRAAELVHRRTAQFRQRSNARVDQEILVHQIGR